MRKNIRKIHLWLGLISGLIVSVVGITGSLYVFEPEISRAITKEYHTQNGKSIFTNDIQIATEIENQSGEKIESLQWPQRGRDTYIFKLFDDKSWHYFDPSTGKIVYGNELFGNSFFRFILDLHTSLTMGETGVIITATSSLIFALLMLTTGICLWWPRVKARLKSSFKIKWNASKKRFNYDLHNVTGFYLFIPLFVLGITGAAFHYYEETQWVLDKITFSELSSELYWGEQYSDTTTGNLPLTAQQALTEMEKYNQNYHKRNMWMSSEIDGTLSFAYQKYSHVHAGSDSRIFLTADRYTGKILAELNPEKLTGGSALLSKWLLPLHFGEFGGLPTRILWFFAGFIPALLTYTGVKIWWGRRNKNQKKNVPYKIIK